MKHFVGQQTDHELYSKRYGVTNEGNEAVAHCEYYSVREKVYRKWRIAVGKLELDFSVVGKFSSISRLLKLLAANKHTVLLVLRML